MGLSTRIEKAVCCYPHLFQRHAPPGTENAKYSIELLLDPANPDHATQLADLQVLFETVVKEAGKSSSLGFLKSPVKDGNEMNAARQAKGQDPRPELENMMVIRASDPTSAPAVVNARMQPISEAQKDQVFGGCIVNCFLDFYWSRNTANPGCYCGLKGVQLVDNVNVTPLGGGRQSVETMFDPVPGAPEPVQPTQAQGPAQDETPSFL